MRDELTGRWGATPKIASSDKSMLHKKGGGSKEGSGTHLQNRPQQILT